MTTTNLVALGLVVLGLGCLLFAALIGGFPLLAGHEATLEMLRWVDRVTGKEPDPLLQSLTEDPLGFVLLTFATTMIPMVTGLAFAGVGFAVWRRIGRRVLRLQEEDAALEPQREQALQELIRERLERTLTGKPEWPTGPDPELAQVLGRLDACRRLRLDLFLQECGLHPLSPDFQPAPWIRLPAPLALRRLLARTLVIVLMGSSTFFFLWGILSVFSVQWMPELVGFPTPPHVSTTALLTSWAGTLTFLTAALGVHRLSRWDLRVGERWEEGRAAAMEWNLASYSDCLTRLRVSLSDGEASDRLARGLTLSALQGLDREGRRRLIDIGLDCGALSPESGLRER